MPWGTIFQWGGTAGIALLVSFAVTIPKGRAEARKTDTDANVVLSQQRQAEQIATLQQTREAADRADRARDTAESARDQCQEQNRRIRSDFEAFADVMEELVPLLPAGESQRKARVALRAARLAI